jgi:uncharacterized membrane protein YkoI
MRLLFAALLGFTLTAAPALAHRHGDEERSAPTSHAAISQQRALEIAAEQGVVRVREVELRRGVWKVEGYTAQGQQIEVEIDPHSGAVVKRELY